MVETQQRTAKFRKKNNPCRLTFFLVLPFLIMIQFGSIITQFSTLETGKKLYAIANLGTTYSRKVKESTFRSFDLESNQYNVINLSAGELPGYTGWPRPERTLVSHFYIDDFDKHQSDRIEAGKKLSFKVRCNHQECSQGGAHFYLRAYGPAVITGVILDNKDGSYFISFYPHDPGTYTVEVVLAFSNTPEWNSFPPENKFGANVEPMYEGFLVPGFPRQIQVHPQLKKENTKVRKQICTLDQLTESNSYSAFRKGRWVVVDTIRSKSHRLATPNPNKITLSGYQAGHNSLGVTMDYEPNDCALLPMKSIFKDNKTEPNILDKCLLDIGIHTSKKVSIRLILIGDSVMLGEERFMKTVLNTEVAKNLKIEYLDTSKGLYFTLNSTIDKLEKIKQQNPKERRFIYFNTGLHDTDRMCATYTTISRNDMDVERGSFVCLEMYRKLMQKLVVYLGEYPAEFRVFRSTTAGWLRYGNFGFSWKPAGKQGFATSPNFVVKLNEIAFDVINSSGYPIDIIDGFWITLPRPDNTESSKLNKAGKHMVHPGVEVYTAMCKKWFTFFMRRMCSNILDDDYSDTY